MDDLQAVSPIMVSDEFGGAPGADWAPGDDPWWPYLPALLGAVVVVIGAMLFTPDQDTTPAPCATCMPAQADNR